ncbi:MAG: metal-transporting ATPase, partial [Abditibacteriota bacterium]|nr:metal-transporting ATPase [Abditibacteriota bacterium]
AISKGRTTDALKSLMKSAPKTAKVIRDGAEREVPVSEVAVDDLFAVRAGDMIPVDGVVLEGSGGVDESSLTGESVPADKQVGDKVSAATINKSGFLKCRATRVGADTTFSQIVRMVSDAAATKAPIARIADKVSAIFVPTVIIIALVVIAGWLIAGQSAAFALARGISVLVISCPCALGLATPVAVMVGSGVGARNGILFKTGEALENIGKIAAAALDKTGTVTKGQPEVTDVLPAESVSEAELAGKAAAAESMSDHPLAKAVSSWAEPMGEASSYKEIPGKGFESRADGKTLRGGNGGYVSDFAEIPYNIKEDAERLSAAGKTVLFFAEDDRFLGAMAVADTLKEDSAAAVGQLGKLGVDVIMLSGDNERTAKAVAREAGIDEVIAGVLPEGKEEVIRALRKRGKVAMVGDGINDAPALTRADIGVAVGNCTDIAAESADVVLMGGGLSDLAAAVRLSRAALGNIRENLFWAFFYNALCIPLAAGLFPWKISPMICAAAMSLSSFSVCMNALRLNFFDIHDGRRDKPLRRKERKTTMEKTIKIKGMMCPHCEATVKKALEALAFVSEAEVSHEKGTAVLALSGDFDENAVRKAVEDKDFTYIGVE